MCWGKTQFCQLFDDLHHSEILVVTLWRSTVILSNKTSRLQTGISLWDLPPLIFEQTKCWFWDAWSKSWVLHMIPTCGTTRGCADCPGQLSIISIHQGIWGSVLGTTQAFFGKGIKHMHVCVCVYIYVYNHYIPPLYSAYRSLKIKLSKSNKTVFVTVTWHDMHVLNPLWLFATSWTVARRVSLFMVLPRQEILEWVAVSFSKNILKFF